MFLSVLPECNLSAEGQVQPMAKFLPTLQEGRSMRRHSDLQHFAWTLRSYSPLLSEQSGYMRGSRKSQPLRDCLHPQLLILVRWFVDNLNGMEAQPIFSHYMWQQAWLFI